MRIARVEIRRFRGIPSNVILDFRARSLEEPISMIIAGDNGTGKSSIIDAVEFGVRGKLIRRTGRHRKEKRRAASFAAEGQPSIIVELDTGAEYCAGKPAERGQHITEPLPEFAIAPIVLRRSDILQLWDVPSEERLLVFFDYFSGKGWGARSVSAQLAELDRELMVLGPRRRAALAEFQRRTHVKSTEEIPIDLMDFESYVRRAILPDYGVELEDGFSYHLKPHIYEVVKKVREINRAIRSLQRQIEALRQLRGEALAPPRALLDILGGASLDVDATFRAITHTSFVKRVDLVSGKDSETSLDVMVELTDGSRCTPREIFSEGALDLLAFLVYLSIQAASAAHGQAKILALDDVFQSVDNVYRSAAVRATLDKLNDWQLLFTAHDRLWMNQLILIARQKGHRMTIKEITGWTFGGGPRIRSATLDPSASLVLAIASSDAVAIAGAAGLLLEEIAHRLSWTLPTSITRREGDRYALGDVWPSVRKKLGKTTARAAAESVDDVVMLRNLLGAHYNDWAAALAATEVEAFAEAVLDLLSRVYCTECKTWVRETVKKTWSCDCEHTKLTVPA